MINMAIVGALTGEGKNDPPPSIVALGVEPENLQIPAVGKQINNYLKFDVPTEDSLVVIWAGANDIFFGGADNEASVANIGKHVRKLSRNGAKTFLIPNLPPLERTPYGVLFADPATQAALQYLSFDFNVRLAAELNALETELGVTIIQFDVYSFLNTVIDNPIAFDFDDVQTPSGYIYGPNPPAGFLFFDDVHPTTQGHEVLADEAKSVIESELAP
jgi:phospholipase/lecithinase/hemolysin